MALPREITESDFAGVGEHITFVGVVEANNDPLTLGRVKVRIFGFHSESKVDIPTKDLPWASVLLPTTSAGVGGEGSVANLKPDTWVAGYFLDGRAAQYPLVTGVIPRVERPAQSMDSGNSGGAYTGDARNQYDTTQGKKPFYGTSSENPSDNQVQLPNNVGSGAQTGDDGAYLTDGSDKNWPLKQVSYQQMRSASRGTSGAKGSPGMRVHRASALALDAVFAQGGKKNINSAYRSVAGQRAVNPRVTHSQHTEGRAFDIACGSRSEKEKLIRIAFQNGFVSFGDYANFVHIDTRKAGGTCWAGRGGNIGWLTRFLRSIGWHKGVLPFRGTKTNSGNQTDDSQGKDQQKENNTPTSTNDNNDRFKYSSNSNVADSQKAIVTEFRNAGYTDAQIAGVLGNVSRESSFNPTLPADQGPGRSGGLFQWNGSRFSGLQNYANSQGLPWTDPGVQARYAISELNGSESNAGRALRNAQTPAQAAYAFGGFERFGAGGGYQNPNGQESLARQAAANDFYGGNPMPGSDPGNTGQNTQYADNSKGFRDPANSSDPGYKGKPSTHMAARGENGGGAWNSNGESARVGGFATPQGGTFTTPESPASPKFPFNHIVHATRTGHIIEMDDSPSAERINIAHKTGTKIEMYPGGTMVKHINGNDYNIVTHNAYYGVVGDYFLGVQGDINLRSTSDMAIHADGSKMDLVYNDETKKIAGKYDLLVGEVVQIKAKKVIIESEDMHFYSTGGIHFHAEKELTFKAGKAIQFQSEENIEYTTKKDYLIKATGDLKQTVKNSHLIASEKANIKGMKGLSFKSDEFIRMDGGKALDAKAEVTRSNPPWVIGGENPEDPTEAKPAKVPDADSADLGKPLKRKKIQVQQTKKQNPDITIAPTSSSYYTGI